MVTRSDKSKPVPQGYSIDGYEVASYYDGPINDHKTPCTQVHFLLFMGLQGPLIMRFKTRDAVNKLIDALIEHRDNVWKSDGSLTNNRK